METKQATHTPRECNQGRHIIYAMAPTCPCGAVSSEDAMKPPQIGLTESLLDLIDKQTNDQGLWFDAATASEEYLQRALRDLHIAVEKSIGKAEGR